MHQLGSLVAFPAFRRHCVTRVRGNITYTSCREREKRREICLDPARFSSPDDAPFHLDLIINPIVPQISSIYDRYSTLNWRTGITIESSGNKDSLFIRARVQIRDPCSCTGTAVSASFVGTVMLSYESSRCSSPVRPALRENARLSGHPVHTRKRRSLMCLL